MKKVKTLEDIKNDTRIEDIYINYDSKGIHSVVCKDGYKFEGERTQEIGNIKDICYSINNNLEANEF
jgi:hypothetical protein